MTSALEVSGLAAGYGQIAVLRDVSLTVGEHEIVALLGANGAGKTTTLRAISGRVSSTGVFRFFGTARRPRSPEQIARLGVAHVPQGRGTFPNLTVEENLLVGAAVRRKSREIAEDVETWMERFPRLGERRAQPAGSLSGGEQQMLALARALMGRPRLLLLDEPSLGLAPRIVTELFDQLKALNETLGTAMLVVEQNARQALRHADRGYVLEQGRIALTGTAAELAGDDAVQAAYLGV
ncbi:MAG TPA: ABC transporter ATP-binding protein [Amycolatopsis sp.]|nr:ABC transporter ATP-binding protein [Amycolatopsis sp.]